MEKRKRSPNVDQKMYDCVKILLNSGATYDEIEKYTKLGKTAIYRINHTENLTEYRNILAAMAIEAQKKKAEKKQEAKRPAPEPEKKPEPANEEPPAKVVEHKQTVTVQTTYYVNQKLDRIEELLKTISAKLACIIDDLYGTGTKKGD